MLERFHGTDPSYDLTLEDPATVEVCFSGFDFIPRKGSSEKILMVDGEIPTEHSTSETSVDEPVWLARLDLRFMASTNRK
jgi:hypothetical protein